MGELKKVQSINLCIDIIQSTLTRILNALSQSSFLHDLYLFHEPTRKHDQKIPKGHMESNANEGHELDVSDILHSGNDQNVLYGAQFADHITLSVSGVVIPSTTPAPAKKCPCQPKNTTNRITKVLSFNSVSAKARFADRV
ncbi:hypothetical protein HD806DRAFT_522329 [Xylariaceae sp. AK1471]|nr:hypothetical protein HD806DRAFT_522329 [Xylariaceae sp. AK1471]